MRHRNSLIVTNTDGIATPLQLSALPKALRRYIHDLQPDADIVKLMRENFRLRQEIATLKRALAAKQEPVLLMDHFFFP